MRCFFLPTIFVILLTTSSTSFGQGNTTFRSVEYSSVSKQVKVELVGVNSINDIATLTDKLKSSNSILDIQVFYDKEVSSMKFLSNLEFTPTMLRSMITPLGFDITLESINTDDDNLKQVISKNEKTL